MSAPERRRAHLAPVPAALPPAPAATACPACRQAVVWLWSPRINRGAGGWVPFVVLSGDGLKIRTHRTCSGGAR